MALFANTPPQPIAIGARPQTSSPLMKSSFILHQITPLRQQHRRQIEMNSSVSKGRMKDEQHKIDELMMVIIIRSW
jgi:hypothetical protein